MARMALFGGRNNTDPEVVDNSDDTTVANRADRTLEEKQAPEGGVEDRAIEDDTEVTERIGTDQADRKRAVVREPVTPVEPVVPVVDESDRSDRSGTFDKAVTPVEPDESVEDRPVVVERTVHARASLLATISLMLGVAAVGASLTGRLAWVGLVAGVLAVLLGFGGVVAGAKPRVAGRGLGTLGLLFGLAAVALAILARSHAVSWLNSDVNEVTVLRHWLDVKLPWTKSW